MEKKKKGKKVVAAKKNGRPPKYDSLESLLDGINKFFALCEKTRQLPEKAGLCVHLGISRETYSQYKKQFPDAIRFANNYIESNWVRRLGGASATGAIFYLKNAFRDNYKDKYDSDVTLHQPTPILGNVQPNNSTAKDTKTEEED